MTVFAGIDIGGTSVKIGFFDSDCVLLRREALPTVVGDPETLADQIAAGPAENPLGGGVGADDAAFGINREDGFHDAVGNGLQALEGFDGMPLQHEGALHRAHSGLKDDEIDGLGQVVVTTGIEPFDQILVAVERREENDGDPGFGLARSDAARHFKAIWRGHHDVEQDEIR